MDQELEPKNEVNEQEQTQEFDAKAIMARMEKMEATNARLLEESQNYKNKYRGLRDNVEKEQTAKLEESENWKDLLTIEKDKRSALEVQLRESRQSTLKKELGFKVASLAKDAHNVDDILGAIPRNMLNLDEENFTVSGVDEAVNFVRESKPYLFSKNTSTGMTSARPQGMGKPQTYDEMDEAQKDALFNEALGGLV